MPHDLPPVVITERSRAYLLNQKGELAYTDGAVHWSREYRVQLEHTFHQIMTIHPNPRHVLDIGSGLGGIDVLLMQQTACQCVLIDGEAGGPEPVAHAIPFCSRAAVVEFMSDNHIAETAYQYASADKDLPQGTFDLVLSLRSWCFHYPPATYLDYVVHSMEKGAHLILDVRRNHRDWRRELRHALHEVVVLDRWAKGNRVVFEKRWT